MNERFTSIAYGAAAGAAVVQLGVPALVVIPIAIILGVVSELYRGHIRKLSENSVPECDADA